MTLLTPLMYHLHWPEVQDAWWIYADKRVNMTRRL
jgi:hypothetical protein